MTTKVRTVDETAEEIIIEAHKQIGSRSLDVVKMVKLHDAIVELLTTDREAILKAAIPTDAEIEEAVNIIGKRSTAPDKDIRNGIRYMCDRLKGMV